ncbi:MAG: hypothetical protein MUO85_07165 [candidate division Zixibacteria bacterium]|nr:hypothetical protein [candidate division Zixibacteria bacterium]
MVKKSAFPTKRDWKKAISDPVFFAREFLQVEPHPGQARWLLNSNKSENLLHTGNRWGKSLVQAIKILHRCLFKIRNLKYDVTSRYQAVNVSITLDQAKIVFETALRLANQSKFIQSLIQAVNYSPFPHIAFGNGSVFWVRSTQDKGEYLLGYDFDYLNYDEVAFEPNPEYVIDQIIVMRLADREGMLDLTSTPKGRNWFFRKCQFLKSHPELGYVQSGSSEENPHISHDYLQQKISFLSAQSIQQNIFGNFVEDPDQVISEEYIQKAMAKTIGLSSPLESHTYIHGWDLGRKQSYTVGITLDVTQKPYQVVAFDRFQRDWKEVYAAIRQRHYLYGGQTIIDSTGLGDVVLSELKDIRAIGFNFGEEGGRRKSELIFNLQQAHQLEYIAYPFIEQISDRGEIWTLQDELRNFYWEDNNECDAVMALALALWGVREQIEKPIIVSPRVRGVQERF